MSRSADSSCKGYRYQQLRMINLIFTTYENDLENDNIFLKEEGNEDIDFTVKSNEREDLYLYQEKYHEKYSNQKMR